MLIKLEAVDHAAADRAGIVAAFDPVFDAFGVVVVPRVALELRHEVGHFVLLKTNWARGVMREVTSPERHLTYTLKYLLNLRLVDVPGGARTTPNVLCEACLVVSEEEEEAGDGAEDEEVEGHHDVAQDYYAAHELVEELCALVVVAVVFFGIVDHISIDEPRNDRAVDDHEPHHVVVVASAVEVPYDINFEQICERPHTKQREEDLVPHQDGDAALQRRRVLLGEAHVD